MKRITTLEYWIAIILGAIMAAIDTAILYLGIDLAAGYSLDWKLVLVAWWILQIHESDWFQRMPL
jgi:hypothetical protein